MKIKYIVSVLLTVALLACNNSPKDARGGGAGGADGGDGGGAGELKDDGAGSESSSKTLAFDLSGAVGIVKLNETSLPAFQMRASGADAAVQPEGTPDTGES